MFIEIHSVLTDEDGAPIETIPTSINIASICAIHPMVNKTLSLNKENIFNKACVTCVNGAVYKCRESYDELKAILAQKEAL